MRICIFGCSHVACFKHAWDALDERPASLSVDFVASPGAGLAMLEAKNDHIETDNAYIAEQLKLASGGANSLRPDDYDAILMVGLGLWLAPTADGLTSAVFARSLEDLVEASLSLKLGKMVGSLTNAPIYVAHNPLPAAAESFPAQRSYVDQYRIMKAAFDRYDMRLLPQLNEAILLPFNTPVHFSRGARQHPNLKTGETSLHPVEDNLHMNVTYGLLHFRAFLGRLQADGLSPKS